MRVGIRAKGEVAKEMRAALMISPLQLQDEVKTYLVVAGRSTIFTVSTATSPSMAGKPSSSTLSH